MVTFYNCSGADSNLLESIQTFSVKLFCGCPKMTSHKVVARPLYNTVAPPPFTTYFNCIRNILVEL